jgi:hypothetical protein
LTIKQTGGSANNGRAESKLKPKARASKGIKRKVGKI